MSVPQTPAHGAVARLRSEVCMRHTTLHLIRQIFVLVSLVFSVCVCVHTLVSVLQVPNSQAPDEEDFSGGAWAAMKAEMGLDEKNPSCFLHSYSVVMVLRKVGSLVPPGLSPPFISPLAQRPS